MTTVRHARRRQTGFTMLEVMISLVILLLGIIGLAGMLVTSQRVETESYQRAQALLLLQDMVARINVNRTVAPCYAVTISTSSGAPYLGVGSTVTPNCGAGSISANTQAVNDTNAWSNLLAGSAEQLGTVNVGAMVGARGCISQDATTGVLLLSVAWQGIADTVAPISGLTCATGLYGAETKRRVVSVTLQIANLN